MASIKSILKTTLNLNHKCTKILSCEEKVVKIQRFGETFDQLQIFAHCEPYKKSGHRCPFCKKRCPGYDTKRDEESKWRAPNLNGIPVYICYRPVRINCPEHGVQTEYIPWSDGKTRSTADFNDEVAWLVCRMSKTAISQYLCINWHTVGDCIEASHNRIEPDITNRMHDLKRICVDETSYRKGQKYITVVYDMDRNRVVWVHDGNGFETFRLFCEELSVEERDSIEIVAGDGASWIDRCTEMYFPNATRCIDFFHVVQWANEKLDRVCVNTAVKANREYELCKKKLSDEENEENAERERITEEISEQIRMVEEELSQYPAKRGRPCKRKKKLLDTLKALKGKLPEKPVYERKSGRPKKDSLSPERQKELDELQARAKDIKRSRYALGHNPENRTEYQTEKIKLIENSYPDLYKAYQLKESLRIILHMKDAELAEPELDIWINDAATSGLTPMTELSEKIKNHRTSILNSIKFQANSAKSEAVNTSIKVLIKMAHGFRNIGNLIALIYLKCSDLVIPLHNRPQLTAEKAAALRQVANENRKKRESSPVPA